MENLSPEEFLAHNNIPFQVFIHKVLPGSVAEAASERNQKPSQVIKTLIFRRKKNSFFAVLCAGDVQVSWPKLRQAIQTPRLTTATAEEVFRITGCKPGTVSPFCLPAHLPVLVDESVKRHEIVSTGSGTKGKALILRSTDMLSCLNSPTLLHLSTSGND